MLLNICEITSKLWLSRLRVWFPTLRSPVQINLSVTSIELTCQCQLRQVIANYKSLLARSGYHLPHGNSRYVNVLDVCRVLCTVNIDYNYNYHSTKHVLQMLMTYLITSSYKYLTNETVWSCGRAVKASFSYAKSSEFDPSLGLQCWGDLSMLISIGLYMFNVVRAARLAIIYKIALVS